MPLNKRNLKSFFNLWLVYPKCEIMSSAVAQIVILCVSSSVDLDPIRTMGKGVMMNKALGMLACATLVLGGCGKKSEKEPAKEMAWSDYYDMPDAYAEREYVFDDKAPAFDELALNEDELDADYAEYDELAWDDDMDADKLDLADADMDEYDFDEDEYDLAELDMDEDTDLAQVDVDDDRALAGLDEDEYDFDDADYDLAEADYEEDGEYDLAYADDEGEVFDFEPIQFAFDSDTLTRGQEEALERDIEVAYDAVEAGESVVIEAYGCQVGTQEYNSPLTQRRAEALKKRFVAAGIPSDKLVARGMGQERPLVWTDATERLQRIRELSPNRRVEISLLTD